MTYLCKIIFLTLLFFMQPIESEAQKIRDYFDKSKQAFLQQNYYTTLNLCRNIIRMCKTSPESECWYTNVMKDVYRYKGLSEFEIYKSELKTSRLEDAIESLSLSYHLFKDPEVHYLKGYLETLHAVLKKDTPDLTGLVITWEALLNLYAHYGWEINDEMITKIKLFIRLAEKFTTPIPSKNYSGVFSRFMIVMACDLATKKNNLSSANNSFFNEIRLKYNKDAGIQWQMLRNNLSNP